MRQSSVIHAFIAIKHIYIDTTLNASFRGVKVSMVNCNSRDRGSILCAGDTFLDILSILLYFKFLYSLTRSAGAIGQQVAGFPPKIR